MDYLETEVKFYIPEIAQMRDHIIKIGAVFKKRSFEKNIRFEDSQNRLIKKHSLLRLRKDDKITLTFKSPPFRQDRQFKVLKELEVEVSDFAIMKRILESLGFHEEQIYEKWREVFILNDTEICLDTMPYGEFIEIEGKKDDIKTTARLIGLNWQNRILLNYLSIFDIIKNKLNLYFNDVTFNNFKNVHLDIGDYLNLFQVKNI